MENVAGDEVEQRKEDDVARMEIQIPPDALPASLVSIGRCVRATRAGRNRVAELELLPPKLGQRFRRLRELPVPATRRRLSPSFRSAIRLRRGNREGMGGW